MKSILLQSNKNRKTLERGKIMAINNLTGRVSVFLRNGLVSAASYLYDLTDLRVGMSVLIGKVDNTNVILNKVSNMPRAGKSFSISRPAEFLTATYTPTIWEDTFPGSSIDSSKWDLAASYGDITVSGGSCEIDPLGYSYPPVPYYAYLGWLMSKAPSDLPNYSVVIDCSGNSGEGGIGLGWWEDNWSGVHTVWGIGYTTTPVTTWFFYSPYGFQVLPSIGDPNNWDFKIKIARTAMAVDFWQMVSGKYKVGSGSWNDIGEIPSSPTTPLYIGIGGGMDVAHTFNSFRVEYALVNITWREGYARYVLYKSGGGSGRTVYDGTALSFSDSYVIPGTTYTYTLSVYSIAGVLKGTYTTSITIPVPL
jgi:hypothetical protein